VPLPSDFLSVIRLDIPYDDGGDDCLFPDDEVFESWKDSGGTPPRRLARVKDPSTIETYPTAVSKSYTLDFWRAPATLSDGVDVPEIPQELHIRLVYSAQAEAKLKEGELAQADRYLAMYEAGLPPRATGRDRVLPGPLSMAPQPGWFETSDYLD
jgi:hypothetical protein